MAPGATARVPAACPLALSVSSAFAGRPADIRGPRVPVLGAGGALVALRLGQRGRAGRAGAAPAVRAV